MTLENLQKESLEGNLWELDDPEPGGIPKTDTRPDPSDLPEKPVRKSNIPEIKNRRKPNRNLPSAPASTPEPASQPVENQPDIDSPRSATFSHDDIGDLGDWDDAEPPSPASPPEAQPALSPTPATGPQPTTLGNNTKTTTTPTLDDVKSTSGKSAENRRKTNGSSFEIITIASVAALIVLGAAFFMVNAFKGLPRVVDPYEMPDLPAKGEHLTINQVTSYWRVPVTSGPNADTVQRDTQLMPILQITATAQNAALRVQFRNSDGTSVGDPVTLSIQGESELIIPSTAGFEDINIHSAYRTGLLDPWTAEILEAPAGTTSGSAFRTVINIPILPDRR